jgi:hypothetical protein
LERLHKVAPLIQDATLLMMPIHQSAAGAGADTAPGSQTGTRLFLPTPPKKSEIVTTD